MRKDVKIGAIVAGALVAVFLVYMIINRMSVPEQTAPPTELARDTSAGDTNMFEISGDRSLTGDTSGTAGDASGTRDLVTATATTAGAASSGDTIAPTGDTIRPTYAGSSRSTGTTPSTDTTLAAADETPAWWGVSDSSDTSGVSDSSDTSGVSDTSDTSGTGGTTYLTTTAQRTYVIQPGDTYSGIAEREYGRAAMFKVIQDANPSIPPKRMIPGKTLIIPPKPETAAATRADPLAKAGTLDVDPATGRRYYIVKATDSKGFWGIAGEIYSHGKHHNILADANPGVNPNRLQAGMKLWAPERVADAAPSALSTAPAIARAAPRSERLETGAPARAVLSDGRVFD